MVSGDIDAGVAKHRPYAADHTGHVLVAQFQHGHAGKLVAQGAGLVGQGQ